MMRKTMRLWMHLILSAIFTCAYANQVDCDFEKDLCSWSIEGFRRISDNQFNSTDGGNDNMNRNGSEWYLLSDATNESYATLTNIHGTNEGLQCLNFWYIFRGYSEAQLQVFVHGIGGDNASAIWETSMSNTGWRRATVEIDVQYSSMVTIFIRGRTEKSYSKIGIDDIVLKLASCLDCNFLDGLCSWKGEEWKVPTKVNYAVTEFKSTREGSNLNSGFDIYPGKKCLSFKYQMKDFKRHCIFIEVYTSDGIDWYQVWSSQSKHQFDGWNEINVTMNVARKSMIAIRFEKGNCSHVTYYISSISLKKQSCTESTTTFRTSPLTAIPMYSSRVTMNPKITTKNRINTIVKLSSTDIATTIAATSVNTSSHYANESTRTFRTSLSTAIALTSSRETMTPKITTKTRINTIVKLSSTDIATTTAATSVNTSSHYANDRVKIGIVIGGLAFTVAVLLIATYLYRRRATSPNANISKHSTVCSVTYSGATRPNTDNGDTSHSTERLNQTSEIVPFNAQAEYSTDIKTQPRQSKTQQRCITGILNIYPCQVQLLNNDGNNVTNPEQTHNKYHQSADKDGTNWYDAVHNTDNYTTEFCDDTYDYTTIYPTTIPDPTYDHSNFKQNFDNIYDHSTSGTLNKDMGYLGHSCDTTLQRYMQDVDPTYDHT